MGSRRVLLYVVGRVISGVVAGFGFAFDYTGASILNMPPGTFGLVGLIAFGVFAVLTLVREIDLHYQEKPRITVTPYINKKMMYL